MPESMKLRLQRWAAAQAGEFTLQQAIEEYWRLGSTARSMSMLRDSVHEIVSAVAARTDTRGRYSKYATFRAMPDLIARWQMRDGGSVVGYVGGEDEERIVDEALDLAQRAAGCWLDAEYLPSVLFSLELVERPQGLNSFAHMDQWRARHFVVPDRLKRAPRPLSGLSEYHRLRSEAEELIKPLSFGRRQSLLKRFDAMLPAWRLADGSFHRIESVCRRPEPWKICCDVFGEERMIRFIESHLLGGRPATVECKPGDRLCAPCYVARLQRGVSIGVCSERDRKNGTHCDHTRGEVVRHMTWTCTQNGRRMRGWEIAQVEDRIMRHANLGGTWSNFIETHAVVSDHDLWSKWVVHGRAEFHRGMGDDPDLMGF